MRSTLRCALGSAILAGALFSNIGLGAQLPPELAKWIPWLEQTRPQRDCPRADDDPVCVFPASLKIQIDAANKLRFEILAHSASRTSERLRLPGSAEFWPQQLALNGAPAPIAAMNGAPTLWLPAAGDWKITGVIHAERALPATLEIDPATGSITVIDHGKQREARRPGPGVLALSQTESKEPDSERALEASVFRRIRDGQVATVDTLLRLKVSGAERNLEVSGFLPEGANWIAVDADLPWEVRDGGRLWLKLRPGVHEVSASARVASPLQTLKVPEWSAAEFKVTQEVWLLEPATELRQVAVEGLRALDPSRLELPQGWSNLQAYEARPGQTARFAERVRGRQGQDLIKLGATRDVWLDFAGRNATSRETLRYALPTRQRIEWEAPVQLKEASIGNTPGLITLGASGKAGFTLPQGQGEATTTSRLPVGTLWNPRAFPAALNLDSFSLNINLPPGYRALWIEGAESSSGFWLNSMSTLDWFALVLCALIARRLFGNGIGAALALGLLFARLYGGTPIQVWLWALIMLAIAKALPEGWFRFVPRLIAGLMFLGLGVALIPWSVDRAQQALHRSMDAPRPMRWLPSGAPIYGVAAPAAVAPAPIAEETLDAAKSKLSSGYYDRAKRAARSEPEVDWQQAVGTKATLAEGIPQWQWHRVSAAWSTPVAAQKNIRIGFLPPWLTALLGVGTAVALWAAWIAAARMLIGIGRIQLPSWPRKPSTPKTPAAPAAREEVPA
jgi:hypothetical protein